MSYYHEYLSETKNAEDLYHRRLKKLKIQLFDYQDACKHPKQKLVQDASGNDSWIECCDCGKEIS